MKNITFLLPLVWLSACATATRGTHERLDIVTQPPGATALADLPSTRKDAIDGFYGCTPTPCGISLPRKSKPVITVSLQDHDSIKFKVVSAVATSATSIRTGAIVAGLPPGSHVVVGKPNLAQRIPVGGRVLTGGLLTFGAASVVDIAAGANRSLSPNPVTVILTPSTEDRP